MNSFAYYVAENLLKKVSLKDKKRIVRAERKARQSLVRFAGHHRTRCYGSLSVKIHVASAAGWRTWHPIRVPRSLRFALGKDTGAAHMTYKSLNLQAGAIWAAYRGIGDVT